ncbi:MULTISPECIES: hypothetical protein [Vibrio]|uniref:hypothetical protein n=1 Tax=Vibrio TaxID=662 RepID=UPI0020764830|nr:MULTISPECIES: hypothetical protein [Vibrio]USD35623.1 hypothetical protein J8Z27_22710 [Vibrio sp. SCSIO 43186]USD72747.1 hypothetical protein J4N41_22715 [Vibrio sp. SCSIO 43139]USD98951.1 hypothetical protein CTT30_23035 [Vibrio coralliilyticus]
MTKIVIKSESEFEEISADLNATLEHPLAYEEGFWEQVNYDETVAALDKWREDHPLSTCQIDGNNKDS